MKGIQMLPFYPFLSHEQSLPPKITLSSLSHQLDSQKEVYNSYQFPVSCILGLYQANVGSPRTSEEEAHPTTVANASPSLRRTPLPLASYYARLMLHNCAHLNASPTLQSTFCYSDKCYNKFRI